VPQDVSDANFSLVNAADPTKKALFSLSWDKHRRRPQFYSAQRIQRICNPRRHPDLQQQQDVFRFAHGIRISPRHGNTDSLTDEVTGSVYEREVSTDLPTSKQFLSPRLYLNTGATAAAIACDCAGLYLENRLLKDTP